MATTTPAITAKPAALAKETILGLTTSLEQRFACTPRNDVGTTLNTKFGFFPNEPVTGQKICKYFTWGTGGRLNTSATSSRAQYISGLNMALYSPRPFRAVRLDQDLTLAEMAGYAGRQVTNINGVMMALYWLKAIDFTNSQVQYSKTDPATGIVTTYEIDYANLSPTAPTPDDNGVVTDVADSISVTLPGTLSLTAAEVMEAINLFDGGDPSAAVCSEIGFVTASPQTVSTTDANNNPFSYEEAIMAQMADQYTWLGQPFVEPDDDWTRTMNFQLKNLIVQQ